MNKKEFLLQLNADLANLYSTPELNNKEDFLDEIVYLVLCTNSGFINVNKAYENLKTEFSDWRLAMDSPPGKIKSLIYVSGNSWLKEKRIKEILSHIYTFNDEYRVDKLKKLSDTDLFEKLRKIPNVGNKIASCIMLFSFGRDIFPVDSNVLRILRRLGVVDPNNAVDEVFTSIQELIPSGKSLSLHETIVIHGRKICRTYSAKCEVCGISNICAYNGFHVIKDEG